MSENLPGITDKRILLSVGPMRAPIDPVRFIQNRSSGKMGLAIAKTCHSLGAKKVTVLLGPVADQIKATFLQFSTVVCYESPHDYQNALKTLFPESDVFFSAAAVLDFETLPFEKKIERSVIETSSLLQLNIRPVPDIVAHFAARKTSEQKVIAFAAESGTESEILARAHQKMMNKSVDAMIANPVWPGLGPDSEDNQVWIMMPGRVPRKLGPAKKTALALPLLEFIFDLNA